MSRLHRRPCPAKQKKSTEWSPAAATPLDTPAAPARPVSQETPVAPDVTVAEAFEEALAVRRPSRAEADANAYGTCPPFRALNGSSSTFDLL